MAHQSNGEELNFLFENLESMPPEILGDSKYRDGLDLQKLSQTSSNSDSNARNDHKELGINSKDGIAIIEATEQETRIADVKNGSSSDKLRRR